MCSFPIQVPWCDPKWCAASTTAPLRRRRWSVNTLTWPRSTPFPPTPSIPPRLDRLLFATVALSTDNCVFVLRPSFFTFIDLLKQKITAVRWPKHKNYISITFAVSILFGVMLVSWYQNVNCTMKRSVCIWTRTFSCRFMYLTRFVIQPPCWCIKYWNSSEVFSGWLSNRPVFPLQLWSASL